MSDFSLLCGFDLVFEGEQPLPKEEYIQGVGKPTLLTLATFLIALDPAKSKFANWKELLTMWFRLENAAVKKQVWDRCTYLQNKYGAISLLSVVAGLKLFEFIFESHSSHEVVDEVTSEVNLFKLYLLFLDDTTAKEEASKNYISQKEGNLRIAATLLNQTFPNSDLYNYQLQEIFVCQIIKSYFIFEFLQKDNRTTALVEKFKEVFGIDTIREYFEHFSHIYKGHLDHPNEGWTEFNVKANEHFDKNCQFLDAISLIDFDKELDADFKVLRGNPIYKTGVGRYSIISPLFTTEKIYKGLYFKLNELNTEIDQARRIKQFRSFYTSNFSENYLLYQVLEYIYSQRSYKRFTGQELAKVDNGLPDYYIRNGSHLFLFENKDIFINAEIKQGGNYEKLEMELQKKLHFEVKDGTTTWKGVSQLANNLKRALLRQNEFDNNYKPQSLKIYPILVLHDSAFNALGFNHVIDSWFQTELEKIAAEGIDVSKVRPVTVLFIDTLILFADFLKVKKIPLEDLLDGYRKHSIFNESKTYKSEDHLKSRYADSMYPFSLFIHKFTDNGNTKVPFGLMDFILPSIFKPNIDKIHKGG